MLTVRWVVLVMSWTRLDTIAKLLGSADEAAVEELCYIADDICFVIRTIAIRLRRDGVTETRVSRSRVPPVAVVGRHTRTLLVQQRAVPDTRQVPLLTFRDIIRRYTTVNAREENQMKVLHSRGSCVPYPAHLTANGEDHE